MNPGPVDDRGSFNPELASLSWADVRRKRWHKYPERCPPFWRPALQKAIQARSEQLDKAHLAERFGVTSPHAAALHARRMERREELNRQRFPGWVSGA